MKPVPDDAGCDIAIWPRYAGFVRSFQVVGRGAFFFLASASLKMIAQIQPELPTHFGVAAGSRKLWRELGQSLGRVRLQQIQVFEHQQARDREPPHHIGPRIFAFGNQFGGHDAGGVAHPVDRDVRVVFLECRLVSLQVVVLVGGVDSKVGASAGRDGAEQRTQQMLASIHLIQEIPHWPRCISNPRS